ncbi:MAG: hypothetical protein CMJ49_05730 [Planctomycetaceae bacterium]|nr:hypothetical protein [Planctomycetaceae bacterium]
MSTSTDQPAYHRTWRDENTGREVHQLTRTGDTQRPFLPYFMTWKHLSDGRLLIGNPTQNRILDFFSGEITSLPGIGRAFQIAPDGSRIYCWDDTSRRVIALSIPDLHAEPFGQTLDPQFPATANLRITADGRYLIAEIIHEHPKSKAGFYGSDAAAVWQVLNRPRRGELWTCDLSTGQSNRLIHLEDHGIIYTDPSPTDPDLIKFCHDQWEGHCQRIWTIPTNGGEPRPVRPQSRGEIVTHDIWWPDGRYIAYSYQDRRGDPTIQQNPWAEYAAADMRFGLAHPHGPEAYLSDPLGHWHSHINVSRDGSRICGEGTHDYPFLCAADFSIDRTRIDFIPQASIHTPYASVAGHGLQADFTADGRWLLYHDTVDNEHHICAVRVEL